MSAGTRILVSAWAIVVAVVAALWLARTAFLNGDVKARGASQFEINGDGAVSMWAADGLLHSWGLVMEHSGLCMNARLPAGSPVTLGLCEEGVSEHLWKFHEETGLLQHASAGCIDRGGDLLHMWPCDSSNPAQRWSYDAANGTLSDPEGEICVQPPMPAQDGAALVKAPCSRIEVDLWGKHVPSRRAWRLGVRFGQVQAVDGPGAPACLVVKDGEVGAGFCSKHAGDLWLFDSSGEMRPVNKKFLGLDLRARTADAKELCLGMDADTGALALKGCQDGRGDPDSNQTASWTLVAGVKSGLPTLALQGVGDRPWASKSPSHAPADLEVRKLAHDFQACLTSFGRPPTRENDFVKAGLQDCGEGDQRWEAGATTGQIQHRHGACLHARQAGDEKTKAEVLQWACEFAQQWSFLGNFKGILRNENGLCLTRRSDGVWATVCRPHLDEQQWSYNPAVQTFRQGGECLEAVQPEAHASHLRMASCENDVKKQEWILTTRAGVPPLFTVETRIQQEFTPVAGVPGRTLNNLGAGKAWGGFRTKPALYLPAVKAIAKEHPRRLVALIDSDVAFGGCDEKELEERYHKVVESSGGASVVVSGDDDQFPPVKDGQARFEKNFGDREAAVQKAFGLKRGSLNSYRDRAGTLGYRYINSGFVMGPAENVTQVLNCMLKMGWDHGCLRRKASPNPWGVQGCTVAGRSTRAVAGVHKQCCFDDQLALTACALAHPEWITIDYTGSVMMTTFGMHNMFEVRRDKIFNKATGSTQCFIHANGNDRWQPFKWDTWVLGLRTTFGSAAAGAVSGGARGGGAPHITAEGPAAPAPAGGKRT